MTVEGVDVSSDRMSVVVIPVGLQKVTASVLNGVPFGFSFCCKGEGWFEFDNCDLVSGVVQCRASNEGQRLRYFDPSDEIYVDPVKYEKAIVDKICDVLTFDVEMIGKSEEDGSFGFFNSGETVVVGMKCNELIVVTVSYDPRPWGYYSITIKDGEIVADV